MQKQNLIEIRIDKNDEGEVQTVIIFLSIVFLKSIKVIVKCFTFYLSAVFNKCWWVWPMQSLNVFGCEDINLHPLWFPSFKKNLKI